MLTKMNSMELKLTNSQTEQMLAKLSCMELKLIKSRVAQMLARLNSMELKLNTMVLSMQKIGLMSSIELKYKIYAVFQLC